MCTFLPRLGLFSYGEVFLAGNGPCLDIVKDGSIVRSIRVFEDGSHIFGISSTPNKDVFVFGERNVAYVPAKYVDSNERNVLCPTLVQRFPDTVMETKVMGSGEIVVLFTCNTTVLYKYDVIKSENLSLEEVERVQSEHTAVMLKGLMLGDSWNDVISIVGTVFGEILVSRPAKSAAVLHEYEGHTGMIFGLLLHNNCLFSISDDRSLRVWSFDEKNLESGKQLSCEFGHSARPFAICEHGGFVYTGGVDESVCKWSFDSSNNSLKILDRVLLNIGGIRSLLFHGNRLWCGSENGGLLGVVPSRPLTFRSLTSSPSMTSLEYCDDLRGFTFAHNSLYTVDGSGTVYRDGVPAPLCRDHRLRYLVTSPGFYPTRVVVAYDDVTAVVFTGDLSHMLTAHKRILSVVCDESYVILYTIDNVALLYTVAGSFCCAISAVAALSSVNKKTALIPSAMTMHRIGKDRSLLVMASGSGQILHCELDGNKESQFSTNHKVNREFGGQHVMCLRSIDNDVIVALGKNGKLTTWRVEEREGRDSSLRGWSLRLLSSSGVSSAVSLDWPCSFVLGKDGREYVTGFHSKEFHMIEMSSGLSVLSIECGGGNRPWQYVEGPEEGEGVLYFIRSQQLVPAAFHLAQFHATRPSIHRSQILFVRSIFPSCSDDVTNENDVIICTGSTDNQLVFSRFDVNTNEWTVLWRQFDPVGYICMANLRPSKNENESILVTGGGKGHLNAWTVSRGDLLNSGRSSIVSPIRKLAHFQHSPAARVVDVAMCESPQLEKLGVAAAHADGSIDLYGLSVGESSTFECLTSIQPVDGSLYTRVRFSVFDDVISLTCISTSGRLSCYNVDGDKLSLVHQISAVLCGLSAVSLLPLRKSLFVASGDESGDVTIYRLSAEKGAESMATIRYHCATVTDLHWHVEDERICVRSTSLDCRLAEHSLDLDSGKTSFVGSKPLAVWDPSSFVVDRSHVIAVGSGIECLKLDESLL